MVGVIGGSIWLFVVLRLIEAGIFITMTIYWFRSMQRALQVCHPVARGADPDSVWFCFIPLFGFVWQFICVTRVSESLAREYHRRGWHSDEDRPGKELGIVAGVTICAIILLKIIFPIHPGLAFIMTLAMCFTMYRHLDRINSFRERLEKEIDPTTAFGQIPLAHHAVIPTWPQGRFVPISNSDTLKEQMNSKYANIPFVPETPFVPQENNSQPEAPVDDIPDEIKRWAPKT